MLYIIELRMQGLYKSITRMPEDRILTAIYRLSKYERDQLQYLKVKFYRKIEKLSAFQFRDKYVVKEKDLPEIEKFFRELYQEFTKIRSEIFNRLVSDWPALSEKLKEYATRFGIPEKKIDKLAPTTPEELLEMDYTVTPLAYLIEDAYEAAERLKKMEEKAQEYRLVAERIQREADRMKEELKQQYEEKIKELTTIIEKLKEALRKQSREVYELKLRARETLDDTQEIAQLVGGEIEEDMKAKAEAIIKLLASLG